MILVIDNYDSFTQNLVQSLGKLGLSVCTIRNDEISLSYIEKYNPTHIVLSPGPGSPEYSGVSLQLISAYASTIPILGVCLGHQAIGYVYGAKITKLKYPMHGKISQILHNSQDLFNGLSNPFLATRYHSLIIDTYNLPNDLEITAWTDDNIIMACRHKKYRLLRGIQFHPESLWTTEGQIIINNFVQS
uniref:Anthranilate synthase component 2 n=1 Tax=Gracilaria vermiculophylla TaxID=2608709 RepID=A0A345U8P7_9FLOR|nr:anthranilate synthase component II [Gracilaria vermiculophylla]AXI96833.1 anthranilate synthase component II [Gracilaria vermiculophylla]QXU75047.1 anthranilate synthase component II [Gracilaria vermiculophylla]WDZ67960.1 anthranilate synthase component II [Gracilaria vermiculophylla]